MEEKSNEYLKNQKQAQEIMHAERIISNLQHACKRYNLGRQYSDAGAKILVDTRRSISRLCKEYIDSHEQTI